MTATEVALICPAGFEAVVARAAENELAGFGLSSISSGFVRGVTGADGAVLAVFPAATNVFAVVASTKKTTVAAELRELTSAVRSATRPVGLPGRGTFRLRIHDRGEFRSTSTEEAARLERAISRWTGLGVARRGGAAEIWVLRRTDEPDALLVLKLTGGEKRTAPGVLKPELCAAIARVEDVRGKVVLDPFAGSGAIGIACSDAGAGEIWLNDVAGRGSAHGPRIRWTTEDVRTLAVASCSIDLIITDPPWGEFADVPGGLSALYETFGARTVDWLAADGRVVMLSGASTEAIDAFLRSSRLAPSFDQPVLVNGRKARLLGAQIP